MRLSEKKKVELYRAISEPITKLRLKWKLKPEDRDAEMFQLNNEIWSKVYDALKLEEQK